MAMDSKMRSLYAKTKKRVDSLSSPQAQLNRQNAVGNFGNKLTDLVDGKTAYKAGIATNKAIKAGLGVVKDTANVVGGELKATPNALKVGTAVAKQNGLKAGVQAFKNNIEPADSGLRTLGGFGPKRASRSKKK